MKRQQRKHEKSAKRDNRKSMASVQSASASGSARMKVGLSVATCEDDKELNDIVIAVFKSYA